MLERENYWLVDVDDVAYEKTLSRLSSPECESTCYESNVEDFALLTYDHNALVNFQPDKDFTIDESTLSWDKYLAKIKELNGQIEEFSKVIQTLALFKYYVKNRRSGVNLAELNKRFNAICLECSGRVRALQELLKEVNLENHHVMANVKRMGLEYREVRSRFSLQDTAVKKLKILIDTFNTVTREYTQISKKLIATTTNSSSGGNGVTNVVGSIVGDVVVGADVDKKRLLNEINSRTKDIQILEQNAKDLNELFAELNSIIKKRGDDISNLENQILLSSEQIEKGKDDFDVLISNNTHLQGLYLICVCIAVGTCFLILPSNIKNILAKRL